MPRSKLPVASNTHTLTSSTGVVIKLNKIPRLLIGELARVPRPRPPVVFMEDLGRSEENPNDPEYLDKVRDWEIAISIKMVDAFILFGTEVVSIPGGMVKQTDPRVASKMRLLGVTADDEDQLYLAWIKYFACPSDEDITALTDGVGRLSGVSEKDVNDALQNKFRDNAERPGDNLPAGKQ